MNSSSHEFSRTPLTPREHEHFERLCALMAIGELTDGEQKDLREHMSGCQQCQELYIDFCQIGSDDLGLLAAHRQADKHTPSQSAEHPTQYLVRLHGRLQRDPNHVELASHRSVWPPPFPSALLKSLDRLRLSRSLGALAAVAVVALLGILSIPAYRRYETASAAARSAQAEARALQRELKHARELRDVDATSRSGLSQSLQDLQRARETLQHDLSEARARNTELERRVTDLNFQLGEAAAQVDEATRDVRQLRATAEIESHRRTDAENKLQVALQETRRLREERTQALLNAADQDQKIAGLEASLASQSASIERTERAVAGAGLEGTSLFGARNLHIVDVYDVDGEGRTKRTYGRVY